MRAFALLALAACADRNVQLPESPEQHRVTIFEIPALTPRPVDVLLVIDNGEEMAPHEDRVAANLPTLARILDGRAWWDVHLGVITSDVGCDRKQRWQYEGLTNDLFVNHWRHLDGTVSKNFHGKLDDQIVGLAAVGHDGCGLHRPLDAIEQALNDPPTGFRRPEADLVVVVIGARDDASAVSLESVAARFTRGPRDPLAIIVAIYPPSAPRLDALVAAIQPRDGRVARGSSILEDDFDALSGWWGHGAWWGDPCLEGRLFDRDAGRPGVQPECAVSDVVRTETGQVVYEQVLPECTGTNRPCWRIIEDRQNCPGPFLDGSLMNFDRIDFPPVGTHIVGGCITEFVGETTNDDSSDGNP